MTLHLSDACLDAPYSAVTITDEIPDIWITSLFDLKGMTNPIHRAVVPSMYRAIPKETICASIWKEGKIIATGLGILDRDYNRNLRDPCKGKISRTGICTPDLYCTSHGGHEKRC